MKTVVRRREFLKWAGGAMAALGLGEGAHPAALAAAKRPPNIIFILADDFGRDWLGCYGGEEDVTPNLDQLAQGGMRFETCYCTPLCTPTRHELLTGRYPFRTGWTTHYDTPRWGGQYFDWNREITFARVLKPLGYATAVAGKWQMNDFRTHPDALARHGFDEHCLWTGFETGNEKVSSRRYWDAFIQTNGDRKTHTGQFGPDVVSDFVLDFVRRKKDGPFLLYYPMMLIHGGLEETPDVKGQGLKKGHALTVENVRYLDELVGKLVATLDELGIREETIVFFSGDNGSADGAQAWGAKQPGGKGKVSERGVHTPLIANCPGTIPTGAVTEDLVDFSDVLPTLAELAGAPLPEGVTLDGRSFASTLQGRSGGPKRDWIYSQLGNKRVVRDKRFSLYNDGRFYDLKADRYEEHDLSQSRAAETAAARERLQKVLDSLPEDAKLPFEPRERGTKDSRKQGARSKRNKKTAPAADEA